VQQSKSTQHNPDASSLVLESVYPYHHSQITLGPAY
jgi:hypothetical protein